VPEALPIACSLSATALPERLQQMAALGRDALLDTHTDGRRAQLSFAAGAGIRSRLEAIVAAESDCCAFLTMTVSDGRDAVELSIEAPEGAEVVLSELVDAFAADRTTAQSPRPAGRGAAHVVPVSFVQDLRRSRV
jgi:hypothetical protein